MRAWYHTYGLPVVLSNCSNNYGPYHFPEKLIPLVILNALESKPLPVYGKGDNVRDWLFVEDHARALAVIAIQGRVGESYNVGGRSERTNLAVVEAICDILDRRRPRADGVSRRDLITFVTDRPGHDRRYAIDASKIDAELGWRPQWTFEEGLARDGRLVLGQRRLVAPYSGATLLRRAPRRGQRSSAGDVTALRLQRTIGGAHR